MKINRENSTVLLMEALNNQEIEESKVNVFEDNLNDEEEIKIKEKAKEFLEFLSNKEVSEIRALLENITIDDIESLESSSALLTKRISQLDSIKDSESSSIANSLIRLNTEISYINPHKYNFESGKLFSWIPFVGKPIDKYLKKFKSAKELIIETISHLEEGEKLLKDDNIVLQHDKKRYREIAIRLQRKALIFEKIIIAIENSLSKLEEQEKIFYENNLLLNLHKKIRSIYEILVVTQESFLSSELIINTNWELIDNISNVKVVTKRALETGVAMFVALENQKSVLDAVNKTKEVTNDLILNNAKTMNNQATQIYNDAAKGTITIETLKNSFDQINDALMKIDTFKLEAVEKIKNEVATFKTISSQLEEKVKEAEKVESLKVPISLEI